jgi:hypothetical protein
LQEDLVGRQVLDRHGDLCEVTAEGLRESLARQHDLALELVAGQTPRHGEPCRVELRRPGKAPIGLVQSSAALEERSRDLVGIGEGAVGLDRRPGFLIRVVETARLEQGARQLGAKLGIVGVQLDGAPQPRGGVFHPVQSCERHPAEETHHRVLALAGAHRVLGQCERGLRVVVREGVVDRIDEGGCVRFFHDGLGISGSGRGLSH